MSLAVLFALSLAAQPAAPAPFTVLTKDARRPLPVRLLNGQEMFALDDLARLFDLTSREDTLAGGLTIATKTQTIACHRGQALASVAGRVVSLPAPPVNEGRSWFVPIDFVPRALAPALGTRLELRQPSRLIVGGDVRVPRITARIEPLGAIARVTFDVAPATPHTVAQEGMRLLVRFEADALDATLPASPAPDLVQAVHVSETPLAIAIDLGPRFASFRSSDAAGERGAGRIVVDVVTPTTERSGDDASARRAARTRVPAAARHLAAGGVRTIVIDPGHGGDEHGARGPQGTLEKDVTLGVARRLKAAIEARLGVRVHPDARRRSDRRPRRARGARQQQQGGPVHQPARQRVGARLGGRRRSVLSEPRRLRRAGAARRAGRERGAAGLRRRHARHRGHPVGDGAGAAHRAVRGAGARPSRRRCASACR